MDVERNYRSCENKEPSYSVNSITNATFSKFLAKRDLNAITELVGHDNEQNDNKSGTRNEFYLSKSKDSSNTHGDAFKAGVGENVQEYSMKHDNSELSFRSGKGSISGKRELYNDHSKNDVQAKVSVSSNKSHNYNFSCSNNVQNLNNYLAQFNQATFQHEEHGQGSSKGKFPLNMTCAEKTTYCRPVYNYYNKDFVNKTLEKNIKLQKLLKKIVLARKREKEKEKWNNYLNELKNKHSYYSHEPRHISPQYVPRENMYPGLTNDYYNTQSYWNDSKPFGGRMHSVYGYKEPPAYEYYYPSDYERTSESPVLSNVYRNEQCCFPTSSQGRFMMMKRERLNQNPPYHPQTHRFDTPTPIIVERKANYNYKNTHSNSQSHGLAPPIVFEREMNYKNTHSLKNNNFKIKKTTLEDCGCSPIGEFKPFFKEKSEQAIGGKSSVQSVETTKEKYERVTENVNRLKEKLDNNQPNMQRKTSLKVIESKLDALMTSLNNFMAEMKSKKIVTSPSLTPLDSIESSDNSRVSSLPPKDSSCCGVKRKSVTIVSNATNTSAGVLHTIQFNNGILRHATGTTRISNILDEERDKSNKLRREIEELLPTRTKRPCVQITFDIPTKERATEVTNSLSKTKLSNRDTKVNEVIEEIMSPNRERHRKMTIAVNTDPLGLLALFRVSSEAIKRLMSYVDYNWYFSRLPFPQVAKSGVYDYICNICGDAFSRPSQLSDHIRRHKLGSAKDCCVCRHALESKRCSSSLFGCHYCGQVFTRAYCCELHQQTCARRFGRQHDVSSSLVVLS